MSTRSELPGEIKRRKFTKSLQKIGFIENSKGGKGNHLKYTWPKNNKNIVIPERLDKDVLYYILKEIKQMSGITWKDINDNF